jgi:tRNA pseudouridine55 synthase
MITRKNTDLSNVDFATGSLILIDKDPGWTSFDVVNKIRKIIKVKKVGHTGTLDPSATGLLIVCTGKKTKTISEYQNLDKIYSGIITLGKSTLSMDDETPIVEEKSINGISNELIETVRSKFIGEIYQVPPMYSALKYKGKALYKYARKGEEINRRPRKINIHRFDLTKIDLPDLHFVIESSKGTYIRVVADDFGKQLGCGAYLKKLRRTAIGSYTVEDALKVTEFEELTSV